MNTIIVKVTDSCNLKCAYCYAANGKDGVMSYDTLKNTITRAALLNRQCHFIWHGGEPLLAGIDFFEKVVALESEFKECTFTNGIQTNGTLLTNSMLDFFEANNFRIGFSLDGNRFCHDSTRPYKSGKSSFADTLYWMKEVKRRGIGGGGICVLNKTTASNIKDIYDFSKQEKINFQYNPLLPEGRAFFDKTLELSTDELARAYIELFDLWFEDSDRPNISFFSNIVNSINNLCNQKKVEAYDCALKNKCQYSIIAIAANGDIYPCGRFVGNKNFSYGNVNENLSTESLLNNSVRKEFITRHKGLNECMNCRYISMCNSGCPNSAFSVFGTIMHKDPFCESYRQLFSHVENKLEHHQSREDVYVIPSLKNNRYIVYSPLRKIAFWANNSAAEIFKNYLNGQDIPSEESVLLNRINQLSRFIPNKPLQQPPLQIQRNHATIILTNKCNMHCSYCYAQASRNNDCIGKGTLIKTIDYISQKKSKLNKYTFIGGGEPTLEWNLFEFAVNYIYDTYPSQKNQISLTTNTVLLDEKKIQWIKQHNIHVSVSCDILPDLQNAQRPLLNNANSAIIVSDKIRLLLENKVDISIRSTVTQAGVDRMSDMVEYVHDNYPGIKSIHLESIEDEFMNNAESYYTKFVDGFWLARNLGKKYKIDLQNSLTNSVCNVQNRFCPIEMCITPIGDIVACHRNASRTDKQYDKFKYGEIRDKLIIDREKYKALIEEEETKFPECVDCFAKYHCAGMCASHRSVFDEKLRKTYCSFTKQMILISIEERLN